MPTSADDRADLLLDTSAAIALVSPSAAAHHDVHLRTHGLRLGLAGHAAFETFSVLTRLPGPQRLSARGAARVISANFPRCAHLDPAAAAHALAVMAAAGVAGGAVYDGLVGLAAREAGIPLLSCDRRALRTYTSLDVEVDVI